MFMKEYKTKCTYGYSILGECPPKLDTQAKYMIIEQSKFFPNCVIIQRIDKENFQGEKVWIVPQSSVY